MSDIVNDVVTEASVYGHPASSRDIGLPRAAELPEGFIAHGGGECPVDPESYVEPLIQTSEGLGSGGVCKARMHDWVAANHPDGLGAVIAYRPASAGEEPALDLRARI